MLTNKNKVGLSVSLGFISLLNRFNAMFNANNRIHTYLKILIYKIEIVIFLVCIFSVSNNLDKLSCNVKSNFNKFYN